MAPERKRSRPKKKAKISRAKKPARAAAPPPRPLDPEEMALARLIDALATRLKIPPGEVLGRALAAFTHQHAPELAHFAQAAGPHPEPGHDGEHDHPHLFVPAAPAPRLIVRAEGKEPIELSGGELVLGSGADCGLRLESPLISPRHARVAFREGRYIFEDLRSERGSFLDGRKLDVLLLHGGEEIDLGGHLAVRFEIA